MAFLYVYFQAKRYAYMNCYPDIGVVHDYLETDVWLPECFV